MNQIDNSCINRINPYSDLPASSFWSTGVVSNSPFFMDGIYKKKFDILPEEKIATAGSCFAQHISRELKKNNYRLLNLEPSPPNLPEKIAKKYWYNIYSARYGNIYTVHQLLQLIQESIGEFEPKNYIWEKCNRYYNALRPSVEPNGFETIDELLRSRKYHLSKVIELIKEMDVFIFTLGLTEAWRDKTSLTVYPTGPGVIAGRYDQSIFEFCNFSYNEIVTAFNKILLKFKQIRTNNKEIKIILTVSPVPLTATCDQSQHVLPATVYSKSTLRAVAGDLEKMYSFIDYFPSFEIITNPCSRSCFYESNLRSIRIEAVDFVMNTFFSAHGKTPYQEKNNNKQINLNEKQDNIDDIICDEAILELLRK